MRLAWCFGSGRCWAGWALWPFLVLGTAWSQTQTDTGVVSGSLRLSGLIKQGSCQSPLRTVSNPNPYVLNLPPLQTVIAPGHLTDFNTLTAYETVASPLLYC